MGLDQYAFILEKKAEAQTEADAEKQVFSWRKHSRLQQFMVNLFGAKGGDKDAFNCVDLLLTKADIDSLEEAVKSGYCQYFCKGGFFWGEAYQEQSCREYRDQDLEFVNAAKQALAEGREVIYNCWY